MKTYNDFSQLACALPKSYDSVQEPFDPEYLRNEPWQCPEIAPAERSFLRKVGVVERALNKALIRFDYSDGIFTIPKYRTIAGVRSQYPDLMFVVIYEETGEYAFGGENEDACVSTRITPIIDAVKEWLSNNKPALR